MRILIVEDDPALRLGIARVLQAEGWQVDAVEDGEKAITAASVHAYDIAVLDLGLPRLDGLSVLKHWRSHAQNFSVLILTARDQVDDRVLGLNLGADDYLGKPFEPEELVARIRALHRRLMGQSNAVLTLGPLVFNLANRELRCAGQVVPLSAREAALIELLMASAGTVVTKNRIVSSMSSWESEFTANSVEIYVLRLRRKLVGTGVKIETVRGAGYRMELSDAD